MENTNTNIYYKNNANDGDDVNITIQINKDQGTSGYKYLETSIEGGNKFLDPVLLAQSRLIWSLS